MDNYIVQPTSAFLQRQELAKKMKTNEEPAAPMSSSSSIFDLTGDSDIEMLAISGSTDSTKVVEPPNATTWGQLFAKPAPTDSVPSFVGRSSGNVAPLFTEKQRTETLLHPPAATSLVSPARPTVATSFLAGSKLSDEWFLGTVMIDMATIGFKSIGPVTIHDLATKKGPKDGILSGAGAGCMFGTGVPIPVANAADSDEVVFEKWKIYGHQVQSSRKVIRSAVESLLAGIMPTPFILPPSIPLGPFAYAVSINPSSSSCTSLAHWIETGRLEKRKGSCGPMGFLLREASKSLERIRAMANDKHWPVPSGAVGMIGPAGQNMNAAIQNDGLPLMMRNPSLYPGSFCTTQLKEQQAQHKELMDQGVLFSVDGNVCTPCEAHEFLELELKSMKSDQASFFASRSLNWAVERMGKPGNAKFLKVCSTHATSTTPGVKGFDIYAYYPPPALSTAQSASSSIDSSVVQEPVRPSAFSLLMSSTGAPLKRTVGRVQNDNAKCPWPGCTHPHFSRTTSMTRHFNSHKVGSTEVKSGGASAAYKKNLKK